MPQTLQNPWLSLLVILTLAAVFRFTLISDIPPGLYPDEAMNGNNILEAMRTSDFKIFYPENNGREGLFINIQAMSVYFFGRNAWALRIVSSFVGTFTVLGLYLVTKELLSGVKKAIPPVDDPKRKRMHPNLNLYDPGIVAIFASFFLSTSYWHINFSRMGFRAIMLPLVCTFGFYWLLKAIRTGKISSTVLAGVFLGLGFYTYIAYRITPVIIGFVILWFGWLWWREHKTLLPVKSPSNSCVPCVLALFLFVLVIVAFPMGAYFVQHSDDVASRQSQVSIFGSDSPIKALALSTVKTLGMFNFRGDCNQRHNLKCQPELFWPVGFFFLLGFLGSLVTVLTRSLFYLGRSKSPDQTGVFRGLPSDELPSFPLFFLFVWFFGMAAPAVLTSEGIPHALRSIGLIPPVMIFASLGLFYLIAIFVEHIEARLSRLEADEGTETPSFKPTVFQQTISLVIAAVLFYVTMHTYTAYFTNFANDPETYSAYSGDLYSIGLYAASLPDPVKKYVIVNMSGVETRGIPMPAQTVMFTTDTFTEAGRVEKNMIYVLPKDVPGLRSIIPAGVKDPVVIIPLNKKDPNTVSELKKEFPEFKVNETADYIVFTNTSL